VAKPHYIKPLAKEMSRSSAYSYGASVKIGRSFGAETTLYKASRCGNTDVVATLLEYGADPNIPNDTKMLPTASKLDAVIWILKP